MNLETKNALKEFVIFLDVDGVLNCHKTQDRIPNNGCIGLDEDKCQLLRDIVNRTNAKIVLSSTWRLAEATWHYLWCRLGADMKERCIGRTPSGTRDELTGLYKSLSRGGEIQAWLNDHPEVTNFIILDDAKIEGPLKEFHVQTNWEMGMTKDHADKIAPTRVDNPPVA